MAVRCGSLSCAIRLRRRSSTRSIFSRRAAMSSRRSITAVASGRPAPRNGAVGTVLVITARSRTQRDRHVVDRRRHPVAVAERHVGDGMRAGIGGELERPAPGCGRAVEAEPRLGHDVARVVVGEERLGAVAGPFHRPAEAARRPHHRDLLGIEIGARAESAADVGADHVHVLLRHLEADRERMPDAVHALAARDQRVLVLGRVVVADRRARLHEAAGGALVADGLLDHQMGAGERGLDRGAVAECVVEREVVGRLRPDRRRTRRERLEHVGDRGQRLVLDLDRFGAVARRREALGHHHGDRLADIAHAIDRERQLRLVEDLALRRGREATAP